MNNTLNKNTDFILNNDSIKTHSWINNKIYYEFKYHLSYDISRNLYTSTLIGCEFNNTHGQGKNEYESVLSLKIRILQLRKQKTIKNTIYNY